MEITISGKEGSGKSCVGEIISKRLGLKYYDIGKLRREAAEKRGMTLEEYNKFGETNPSTDLDVDNLTKEKGKEKNFVLVGRLGWYFIPDSYRIFLDVDLDESARRICHHERCEEEYSSIGEAKKKIVERRASDKKRYSEIYGEKAAGYLDKENYDLVIDTTNLSVDEVVERVLEEIRSLK